MSEVKDQLRQVPNDGVSYGVLQYLSHKLNRPARPTVIINHLGEHAEMQVWCDRIVETLEQSAQALHQAAPFKTVADYKYRLTQADLSKVNQYVADNNQSLSQLIDLTATQSAILFHHLQHPTSDQGLIVATVDLAESVDRTTLQQAWDALIKRHDSLRSHLMWEDLAAPLQVILEEVTSPIEYVDVDKIADGDSDRDSVTKRISDWKKDPSNLRLDLRSAPLNKLVCFDNNASECKLLLVCHHISLDGWSTSNLFSDLMEIYNDLANNRSTTLPQITPLATWKDAFDTVRDEYESLDFWNEYLSNLQPSKLKAGNAKRVPNSCGLSKTQRLQSTTTSSVSGRGYSVSTSSVAKSS